MVDLKSICESRGCQAERLTEEKRALEQRVRELSRQLGLQREQQKENVRAVVKEVMQEDSSG